MANSESKDLDAWLHRDLVLAEGDAEKVAALVGRALDDAENHSVESGKDGNAIEVRGLFGSKLRALFVGLLPFGRHIPWGKRLQLRATIRKDGAQTKASLRATPFMELFDESEALLVSQSPAEKGSDEYLAALHLQRVSDALLTGTKTPRPDDAREVAPKAFAADYFTGLLLYALESDASKKVVHVPVDS